MHQFTVLSCFLCMQATVLGDYPYNPPRPRATQSEFNEFQDEQYPSIDTPQESYDFIVIGAGTAGIPVATRLSEISDWNVLLVEAGDYETRDTSVPGYAYYRNALPEYAAIDWGYHTQLNPDVQNSEGKRYGGTDRTHKVTRGRAVGGCSAVNAMLYVRGHEKNYDNWENVSGNPGWNYQNISKYFQKAENFNSSEVESSDLGVGGPMAIETPTYKSEMFDTYMEALSQFGLNQGNYNNPRQDEYGVTQGMTQNGLRVSTNSAYLMPLRDQRPNLELMKNTLVTKIITIHIDGQIQAIGVKLQSGGQDYTVYAGKEVILSAGAINSPMLLMLSGIGPSDHLSDLGIEVVEDLPVGNHLMNAPMMVIKLKSEDEFFPLNDYNLYNESPKRGPWTIPFMTEVISLTGSKDEQPIFEGWLAMTAYQYNDIRTWEFDAYRALLQQSTIGYVRLNDTNPSSKPNIYMTFLDREEQMQSLLAGVREMQEIFSQPAFDYWSFEILYDNSPPCNQYETDSDDWWRCRIAIDYLPLDHYSGTCKMGPENDSTTVVDAELCVHGVNGLRVIDASIFPTLPTANPAAPVMAVAEKGADLIKNKWLQCEESDGSDGTDGSDGSNRSDGSDGNSNPGHGGSKLEKKKKLKHKIH